MLWMLKTKDMATELKCKTVFLGEEIACCPPSHSAECCSGIRSNLAGQAERRVLLCTQVTAVSAHHQLLLGAAALQPRRHQPPQTSSGPRPANQSCLSFPELFLSQWLLWNPIFQHTAHKTLHGSELGRLSIPLLRVQLPITDTTGDRGGKISNLHLEISRFPYICITLGRERNWAQIFQGYAGASHSC